jgi:hypothetical protein
MRSVPTLAQQRESGRVPKLLVQPRRLGGQVASEKGGASGCSPGRSCSGTIFSLDTLSSPVFYFFIFLFFYFFSMDFVKKVCPLQVPPFYPKKRKQLL